MYACMSVCMYVHVYDVSAALTRVQCSTASHAVKMTGSA